MKMIKTQTKEEQKDQRIPRINPTNKLDKDEKIHSQITIFEGRLVTKTT